MHIGDMLLEAKVITKEQLDSALAYQKQIGGRLGHIMVKLGVIEEGRLVEALSTQLQMSTFDFAEFEPDPALMELIPREVLERLSAVPIRKEMGTLIVGISDPSDFAVLDELRMHAGGNVEALLAGPSQVWDVLNSYFVAKEGGVDEKTQKRSPRRGRDGLSNLVHELGRDAMRKPDDEEMPEARTMKIEDYRTRDLVLGLIQSLSEKNVLTMADVKNAIQRLDAVASQETTKNES